jgi:hypothetical protein
MATHASRALSGLLSRCTPSPSGEERELQLANLREAIISEVQALAVGFARREHSMLAQLPAALAGAAAAPSFYEDVGQLFKSAHAVRRELLSVCRAYDRRCEQATLEKHLVKDDSFSALDVSLRHSPLLDEYKRWLRSGKADTAAGAVFNSRSTATPNTAAPKRIDRPKCALHRAAPTQPESPLKTAVPGPLIPPDDLMFQLD